MQSLYWSFVVLCKDYNSEVDFMGKYCIIKIQMFDIGNYYKICSIWKNFKSYNSFTFLKIIIASFKYSVTLVSFTLYVAKVHWCELESLLSYVWPCDIITNAALFVLSDFTLVFYVFFIMYIHKIYKSIYVLFKGNVNITKWKMLTSSTLNYV